jgi:hypothetical protein
MKRVVIGCLGLGLVGILLLGWAVFGDQSSFQTGLSSCQGVPQTASDITLYQNKNMSGVFVADFKISERDFVSYAAEQHWELQPIPGSTTVFQAKAFHDGRPNDKKEIVDGVFYTKRSGNGGGVTVTYDRKDGRGYIDRSSR